MTGLRAALGAETLKLRRSQAAWVSGIAFGLIPLVSGLFMFVLQDPGRARDLGLLGAKAHAFSGAADWEGFFALMAQATAIGGFLIFAVLMTWLFGREFNERTVTDLLALPTSRSAVVVAKFLVAATWMLALLLLVLAAALVIGALLQLEAWSTTSVLDGAARVLAAGLMAFGVTTPFAFVASAARGYLAAVAGIFATLLLAQLLSALGWGRVFPWAVPGLFAGTAGPASAEVGLPGVALVLATGLAGVVATEVHWRTADHH